jgi:hypothetical protein
MFTENNYKLFVCMIFIYALFFIYILFYVFFSFKKNNVKQCKTNIAPYTNIEQSNKLKKNQYQFKIKKHDNKIDMNHVIFTISQILIELHEKNKIVQNNQINFILENRKITLNDCNNYYTICRSDLLLILNTILEKKN